MLEILQKKSFLNAYFLLHYLRKYEILQSIIMLRFHVMPFFLVRIIIKVVFLFNVKIILQQKHTPAHTVLHFVFTSSKCISLLSIKIYSA